MGNGNMQSLYMYTNMHRNTVCLVIKILYGGTDIGKQWLFFYLAILSRKEQTPKSNNQVS